MPDYWLLDQEDGSEWGYTVAKKSPKVRLMVDNRTGNYRELSWQVHNQCLTGFVMPSLLVVTDKQPKVA